MFTWWIGKHAQVAIPKVSSEVLKQQMTNIKECSTSEQIFNTTQYHCEESHGVRHMVSSSAIKEYSIRHPSMNKDFLAFIESIKCALPAYLNSLLEKT